MNEQDNTPTPAPDRGEKIRLWITTLTPLVRILVAALTTILVR